MSTRRAIGVALLGACLLAVLFGRDGADRPLPHRAIDATRTSRVASDRGRLRLRPPSTVPLGEQLVERARRGLLAWSMSCAGTLANGLCVEEAGADPDATATAPSSRVTRCGPDHLEPLRIAERDPERAGEAIEMLRAVVALYEESDGVRAGDEAAALRAYVAARIALADLELEHHINDEHGVADLRTRYAAIAALGDPGGEILATGRLGQLEQHVFDTLMSASIPGGSIDDDPDAVIEVHCDAVTQIAEVYEERALEEFRSCVDLASRTALATNDLAEQHAIATWSEPCARQLAVFDPAGYPEVGEWTGTFTGEPWDRVRLHIQLRNFDVASELLAQLPPTYEREILRAVTLRGQNRLAEAELAYGQAIQLDASRPEAFFDLGVLLADFRAATGTLDEALASYVVALRHFEQAALRSTGAARDEVEDRIARTRKTLEQLEAFRRDHSET